MSNCIELRNSRVVFTAEEINIIKFLGLMSRVMKKGEKCRDLKNLSKPNPIDLQNYYFWWFVINNCNINSQDVTINFGKGNSSHTWRDLRGLLSVIINPLMKKEKRHVFRISDEFDNFQSEYSLIIAFGKEPNF